MTEKNPIFAVIIPVYNGEEYITDCLDSLINQNYHNWIAVCVNDGSTDKTEQILSDYAIKDQRIHIINKENGGVSRARNKALDYLHNIDYDWISFLDADDMLGIDNLSNLNEIISQYPQVDYIRSHCKSCRDRKQMLSEAEELHPVTSVKVMSSEEYFNNGDVGGLTHSCHLKRSLFEINGYRFPEDMKYMEDQVFSIKMHLAHMRLPASVLMTIYIIPSPMTLLQMGKNILIPYQI